MRIRVREGLEKESDLLIDQVRAIDNKRLISGPLIQLDDDLIQDVYNGCRRGCGTKLSIRVTFRIGRQAKNKLVPIRCLLPCCNGKKVDLALELAHVSTLLLDITLS